MEKLTTMKTEEFEGVSFRVRAVGDPMPNLTWLKDGRELPLAGRAMNHVTGVITTGQWPHRPVAKGAMKKIDYS